LKIPIYHLEAGNRCFDFNVPEEINRRIIDHISDFNLVYTEHARRNLAREGIEPRKIYLTGSPLKEVIAYYLEKIERSDILKTLSLNKNEYFICSMHREENVDNARNLESILQALNLVANEFALPIVVSTHPRTKLRLEKMGEIKKNPNILFLKPFGFFDYVHLQKNSFCVISDSGSISEEAAILSFPAITIRNSMERPEAMDSGNIVLTGLEPQRIIDSIRLVTEERENLKLHPIPFEYTIANTSQRVVKLIIGTAKLAQRWDGVEKNTE
jgi:UDP-N-acetylglucosamine 2-epimerase (non-hydrolysing)